jgi:hypothetical protein
MKKILVVFLLLAALGGFAAGQDLSGLTVGGEVWNAPGYEDNYGDNSFGIAPFAEYEKSVDIADIYLKGEYLINLDDESNQALYAEEAVTFNLGQAGPGALSLTLNNYNLFATSIDDQQGGTYFYPPDDFIYVGNGNSVKKVTGVFEPSAGYEVDAFAFAVGLPIGYAPTGKDFEGEYIDLYGTAGYSHESGFGVEATGWINLSYEWDDDKSRDDFYELDVVLSYTQEKFSASVGVEFPKDWDGKFMKDVNVIPGIEVYLDKLTVYGAVEIDYESDKNKGSGDKESKTNLGFLAGVKYAF